MKITVTRRIESNGKHEEKSATAHFSPSWSFPPTGDKSTEEQATDMARALFESLYPPMTAIQKEPRPQKDTGPQTYNLTDEHALTDWMVQNEPLSSPNRRDALAASWRSALQWERNRNLNQPQEKSTITLKLGSIAAWDIEDQMRAQGWKKTRIETSSNPHQMSVTFTK